MYSRASLNVEKKRKISCSSWNRQVILLSSPGSAQPVARGKHVACELRLMPSTNDVWMRNLVVTLGLAKPSQNVKAIFKTSNLFMKSHNALIIQTVKMLCTAYFYKFFYSEADQCIFIAHDEYQNVKLYTSIIIHKLIHSSFCISNFHVPLKQTKFSRVCPHHIRGWAGFI
jgi:hypothetical protein